MSSNIRVVFIALLAPWLCLAVEVVIAATPLAGLEPTTLVHLQPAELTRGDSLGGTSQTATVSWDEMLALDRAEVAPPRIGAEQPAPLEEPPSPIADRGASAVAGEATGTSPHYGLRFPALDLQTTQINPPDTMGAVGRRHFMEVINGRVAVYDKRTGLRISEVRINNFFSVVSGGKFDPRVLFDVPTGRWIASAARSAPTLEPWGIVLAVSCTDDPLGEWFQVFFYHPDLTHILHDFPMLGVGPQSIAVNACVCDIGGARSLWVFEKAPLLASPPRLGAVTRWDTPSDVVNLIPVQSNGTAGADLVVGVTSLGGWLGVYFLDGPMSSPTLRFQGSTSAPSAELNAGPPPAPGLAPGTGVGQGLFVGSAPVYRNRTLWVVFRGEADGRSAFHWARVNPFSIPPRTLDSGTVAHPSLHIFLASIAVNAVNDVAFGFSGSNGTTFVGSYFAGRRHTDPPGAHGPVELLKSGEAVFGTGGSLRWGDYTATSVDPDDELTFWTIQQYAGAHGVTNTWGTWVGKLSFAGFDCNANGIEDACDLSCDPGCPPGCGESADCEFNGVPDDCEPSGDCNLNGVPDACELFLRTALDCNGNLTPDECEMGSDCDANGVPDECDPDCNENGRPDACDISDGSSPDCNANRILDECESAPNRLLASSPASGTSLWRSRRNVLRLAFDCDLKTAPVAGRDILVAEMLEGGFFGADLSAGFSFSLEGGNVVRIQDRGASLVHGRWYAVGSSQWPGMQHFLIRFPVVVGDANGDGRVSDTDLTLIKAAVPTHPVPDNDRREINGDGGILFADLSAARAHLPTGDVPPPAGH